MTFKQSAKTNLNVEDVFYSIARDIKQRLAETDTKAEVCLNLQMMKETVSIVFLKH